MEHRPSKRPLRLVVGIDDVVLSDAPLTPTLNVRAYSHHLGTSPITWMSMPAIAATLKRGFPKSLDGVPLLLLTRVTD